MEHILSTSGDLVQLKKVIEAQLKAGYTNYHIKEVEMNGHTLEYLALKMEVWNIKDQETFRNKLRELKNTVDELTKKFAQK